jgi:hypothetical protein
MMAIIEFLNHSHILRSLVGLFSNMTDRAILYSKNTYNMVSIRIRITITNKHGEGLEMLLLKKRKI